MNDSFIHDSQSSQPSSGGSVASPMLDPFLAAAMAMKDSPDDETSPGIHIHGKRARMADMPVIQSCLRSMQSKLRNPDFVDLSNDDGIQAEPSKIKGRHLLHLSAASEDEENAEDDGSDIDDRDGGTIEVEDEEEEEEEKGNDMKERQERKGEVQMEGGGEGDVREGGESHEDCVKWHIYAKSRQESPTLQTSSPA